MFQSSQTGVGGSVPEGVRALRILLFTLMGGVAMFAVVASIVGPIEILESEGLALFYVLAWSALGFAVVVALAVRAYTRATLAHEIGAERAAMPGSLRVETLVRAAVFEGAGLVGCFGLLIDGQPGYYAIVALALVGIFLQMPSEAGVNQLLDDLRREA